jgi:hypothetical protein
MSQLATGIFGAIAVSLACGAVELASGHDLTGTLQDRWQAFQGTSAVVNRAAKADRAAGVTRSPAETRTISLRLDGLADTSILVRIPVTNTPLAKQGKEAHDSLAPSPTKPGDRKGIVACEPVVSVLVEIAKPLQPGRCLT